MVVTRKKDITLKEVGKVYDRLGIKFDSYAGESFYNDKMEPVIQELRDKGLLVESTDTYLWYFWPRRLVELPFRFEVRR